MDTISAFVGHSFSEQDRQVVNSFTDLLDEVKRLNSGFSWDHAERAEAKELAQKVREKMKGKNLFIGICTEREFAVERHGLKAFRFLKECYRVKAQDLHAKTSDWILAEIWYAAGKGMSIILLLENGVKPPEGPQGNLEYIRFHRDSPGQCHKRLMEMLNDVIHKTAPKEAQPKTQDLPPKESEPPFPDQLPTDENRDKWDRDDYSLAILKAIIAGDSEKEQNLHDAFDTRLASNDEFARVWMDARTLWYHHTLKKKDTLPDLLALREKHPTHPVLNDIIGLIYSSYGEYSRAAEYFAHAASSATDDADKLSYLSRQASALASEGDVARSKSIVKQAVELAEKSKDCQLVLLRELIQISKQWNHSDSFIAYSEKLLELQPGQGTTRFELASKYSELGEHDLALYHYRILTDGAPSSASWNNLGVAQSNLGLPSLAVKSYRESEKMSGTVAMSNLAQLFINAGFLDEAKQMCDRAMQIENYDKEIGTPISRLRTVPEAEDKKANEAMEGAKAKRRVYTSYAEAALKPMKSALEGTWSDPQCRLTLKIDQGTLEAFGTYEMKISIAPLISYGPPATKPEPIVETRGVWYTGDVLGHGIQYRKWEFEGRTKPEKETDPESEGFMILSDDRKRLQAYPMKGKKAGETFELKAEGD